MKMEKFLKDENCFEAFYGGRYRYDHLVRYQLMDASIMIPRQLEVLMNLDGYDLMAIEGQSSVDSPLTISITRQQLDEGMTPVMKNQQLLMRKSAEIKGIKVDGYQGMIIKNDLGFKGCETSLIVVVNQIMIKVTVLFNEYFVNMDEVTNKILKSFHLNLPQDPSNASVKEMKAIPIHAGEESLSHTLNRVKKLFKGRFIAKQLA